MIFTRPTNQGQKTHWCEVKSISGSLEDQLVSLSSTQFEYAQKYGQAYWLYVVEHADDEDKSCIIQIQDPAQKAGTFTSNSVELDIRRDHLSRPQARFRANWKGIAT